MTDFLGDQDPAYESDMGENLGLLARSQMPS